MAGEGIFVKSPLYFILGFLMRYKCIFLGAADLYIIKVFCSENVLSIYIIYSYVHLKPMLSMLMKGSESTWQGKT